ncbi:MAG: GIY-YIG nuclease family protein [Pseudomonadota bacterium]|nr:GIY-YIG nuclease family protein [Pseudomonadota bacterium]
MKKNKWQVYILKCSDDSLYTGITNDLAARIRKHNSGEASKYTRSRLPVRLVYKENQPDRSTASQREANIKTLNRAKKFDLIANQK